MVCARSQSWGATPPNWNAATASSGSALFSTNSEGPHRSPCMKSQDLNVILATDCGSTTTKAILIQKRGQEYRQTYRGEAPTTVGAPF